VNLKLQLGGYTVQKTVWDKPDDAFRELSCEITEMNCTCIIVRGGWLGCVPFIVHDLIASANANVNDKII